MREAARYWKARAECRREQLYQARGYYWTPSWRDIRTEDVGPFLSLSLSLPFPSLPGLLEGALLHKGGM